MAEKKRFRVSVRDLVATACLPESLSSGFSGRTRALEGIHQHSQIQQARPQGYEAEVPVSLVVESGSFDLEIFGRLDGMMVQGTQVLIEEIKTCRTDPAEAARSPDIRHLSQLKCYGYMVAKEKNLASVDLRLTYARAADSAQSFFEVQLTFKDLARFFDSLLTEYLRLLGTRTAWERIRNRSIASLNFPFAAFRKGQRDLAEAVYKVIKHQNLLFARAPTGTGKTMACLFPAVKALGLGLADKIFYLTAKTPGRAVAQNAVRLLAEAGARVRCVTITAKQKTCFTPDLPCDMETCPYARSYYTKLSRVMDHLSGLDHFDQNLIETAARAHEICPFELSLDLSLTCDIIICDLNYAFDPRVYLKRFFDRNTENLVFLMDEAHNLPDRIRSMYSAGILRTELLAVQAQVREGAPRLGACLASICRQMARLAKDLFSKDPKGASDPTRLKAAGQDPGPGSGTGMAGQTYDFAALPHLPEPLMEALDRFALEAELWLDTHEDAPLREQILEAYYLVNGFLSTARHFGSHFRFFIDREKGLRVRLFCLDPAKVFSRLIRRCQSAIFFSATFFPFSYFSQVLLGTCPDPEGTPVPLLADAGQKALDPFLIPYAITLSSPFPPQHLKVLVHQGIKTTFRARPRFYQAVADAVAATVRTRPGNYLIFFPSYAYMESVRVCLDPAGHDVQVQAGVMDESERQAFVEAFEPGGRLLGFAVMGGIFGEGIDLRGDRLVGVMVVGVGLPQVCPEQEQIRAYYDSLGLDGFFTAYQMPGFSRVMQAAGRLIRTAEDRGVVLLMDQRFLRPDYLALFPSEWQGYETLKTDNQIPGLLKAFWENPAAD